jgi:hypothetical protein
MVECLDPGKQLMVMLGGHVFAPGEPVVKRRVLDLDQLFISIELRIAQAVQCSVGEMPEDKIHLLDAAMPGPKLQLTQANSALCVTVMAGFAGHFALLGRIPSACRDIDREGPYVIRMAA